MSVKKYKISDVADLIRGVNYSKEDCSDAPKKDFIKLLRANNINNDELNEIELVYVHKKNVKPEQIIKQGDIVLAMSSGSKHLVGKSALSYDNTERAFGAFCGLLRVKGDFSTSIISYVLKSQNFRNYISEISSGTNINNLKREHVLDFEFMIPSSFSEQNKLAQKVDVLFSEIDSGVEELKKTKKNLELYKQSVLNAAIKGKLVPQDTNDEPASKLLGRIRAEKEALIKAGKLKKEKSLPPVDPSEVPFDLPKGWEWARLGEIIKNGPSNGLYKSQSCYGKGTRIVRIDSYYNGKFIPWNELKRLQLTKEELAQYKVAKDDFILNRVNSIQYIAKSVLVESLEEPLVYESNMMKFSTFNEYIDNNYLLTYLNSARGLLELRKNAKHAVNQASINQEDVRNSLIVVPPLKMQKKIQKTANACVDTYLSECDVVFQIFKKAQALKQSILKQAFEGSLC